ncbi:MAG: alpha/beta hydrolase [Sphingomonas sp.]|nr:alpha/beta hydrolase [Sphingomonas sp.]
MRLSGLAAIFMLLLGPPLAAQAPAATAEIAYGADPRQRLDYTRIEGRDAPLVLFVHGGGWRRGDKNLAVHMAAHFHEQGYAFATINYRLVPDATVDGQAADVASAIARLRREPGVDPRRILLIGHSAGAHLVALVGTDPAYLGAHRIALSDLAGIVPLDGAGYDVPRQIAQSGPLLRHLYRNAFGDDPEFQRRVSPIAHAAAPNAPRFLILHIASRPDDSGAQSEALAAALRTAGTPAEVASVPGSHSDIFRNFGRPGHEATALVDAFAADLFATEAR